MTFLVYNNAISLFDNQMPNPQDALVTQQTLHWIRSFVVEYNICPFAKRVIDQGTLTIEVTHAHEQEMALVALLSVINLLNDNNTIETALLVFPEFLSNFFDYLDFVDLADALMLEQGYEGIYQLATFHPDYCFAGVDSQDVSNYTNRSPYPMLHLLREASVDKAIEYYGNTEEIPDANIATMHALGLEKIKKLLQSVVTLQDDPG